MKLLNSLALALCLPAATAVGTPSKAKESGKSREPRYMKGSLPTKALVRAGKAGKAGKGSTGVQTTFSLTTFHKYHHFGFWFIMVHDDTVGPIFTPNEAAIAAMEGMCEAGDPTDMVSAFQGTSGVHSVEGVTGALFGQNWDGLVTESPGAVGVGSLDITVDVPEDNLVTIIAMIANSNDGCIILDGVSTNNGDVHTFVEIDTGTEANSEECGLIAGCGGIDTAGDPGIDNPNCPCGGQGNEGSQEDGEGFMSHHAGVGIANDGLLRFSDWRAPMVVATVNVQSVQIA